jgi:flagellar basal-body rod protein FlgF
MADGIYVSMCGAVARQEQLDSVADNLANVQTRGYKASRPAFEAFLPAAGGSDKSYTASVATGLDLRPGPTTTSGNPLDVVPENGAFLAVQSPGGAVAYTRDGRIAMDAQRRLTIAGNAVMGRNGNVLVLPADYMPEIDPSGQVRGRLQGPSASGRPDEIIVGEIATFQLGGSVDRIGASLFRPAAGGRAVAIDDGRLRVGEVELGNASALESTVAMIAAQRSFDASMQAIQTYRTLDQRAAEVGRVR